MPPGNSITYLVHQNPLEGILAEEEEKTRDLLLCAFSMTLDANNLFTRNRASRNTPGGTAPGGIFSRHDFQPKATFVRRLASLKSGVEYARCPFDGQEKSESSVGRDPVKGRADLQCTSANPVPSGLPALDFVVTDPPYAGNINYSELADFFYVWLRLALGARFSSFAPELCPKAEEIVMNPTRGQDATYFQQGLKGVFDSARLKLRENGLVVFTFHHREGDAWESLLKALCDAGYVIEAVFPVQGESENAMPIMGGTNITYDLIHVCRVRDPEATRDQQRTTYLERQGLRVLRFNNLEVLRELEAVMEEIYRAVQEAINPPALRASPLCKRGD